MIEINQYARKPFIVEAVQVSEENMFDAARWCKGEVRASNSDAEGKHIKVHVKRPLNARQTKAFVGDWILSAGTGFKVYTNDAFLKNFEPDFVVVTE